MHTLKSICRRIWDAAQDNKLTTGVVLYNDGFDEWWYENGAIVEKEIRDAGDE